MERVGRPAFIFELELAVQEGFEHLVASNWTLVGGGLVLYVKYPNGLERVIEGPDMSKMDDLDLRLFLTQVQMACEGTP